LAQRRADLRVYAASSNIHDAICSCWSRRWELDPATNIYTFAVHTFIMVTCLVVVLPALELGATALYRTNPARPVASGQLAAAPCASLSRAQAPQELRSGWTKSDILVVVLYSLYNVFALLVPLWFYDINDIYWEEQLPKNAPPLTLPARWLYVIGAVSAWPCLGNMALAMFPTSRVSPLLAILGAPGYQQLLWVHKLSGRLCFFWLSMHGELTRVDHHVGAAYAQH
jgi:hypothetical protein